MVTQQRPYDHLLNEQQQKAVYSPHNRLLIVAGAGTGKTRAITHRIGWLINHQNIPPEHVVAVTFTNRAADEMRERVQTLTDRDDIHKTRISTFHSPLRTYTSPTHPPPRTRPRIQYLRPVPTAPAPSNKS